MTPLSTPQASTLLAPQVVADTLSTYSMFDKVPDETITRIFLWAKVEMLFSVIQQVSRK